MHITIAFIILTFNKYSLHQYSIFYSMLAVFCYLNEIFMKMEKYLFPLHFFPFVGYYGIYIRPFSIEKVAKFWKNW